ncbi:MAG: acyloxyacyl hydrolase, partial [Nitrospirales bacterium]
GIALTKARWPMTVDFGVGGALLSKWRFPGQNVGGPFQIIAHGGLLFHLPLNLLAGYRFHHMSDATIYGNNRGVDLHMLEVRYRFSSP